jgi:uncharacterized membrane protein
LPSGGRVQEGRDNKPKGQSVHLLELSPNCSLTSRSATLFYLSVSALALPVAVAFAAAGMWPILPFAGLELLGLGAALVLSLRRGRIRELIRIDERDVVVARTNGRRRVEVRFTRAWTRVQLRRPAYRTWPSRLLLGSMGRTVEVGSFLTEPERRSLKLRLVELIRSPEAGAGGEPES